MNKKVKLSFDVLIAAQVRQVLFDAQRGHSYDFPTTRITNIRKIIEELDTQIEKELDTQIEKELDSEYGTK